MKRLHLSTMSLIAMIAGLLLLGGSDTFAQSGTASSEMFGDGRDGDLVVRSGQTVNGDNVRSAVGAFSPSGQRTLAVSNTSPFGVGDEVLVIQMQGAGNGLYEFGTIESKGASSFTMQQPLSHTYTAGANNRAQVLKVPQYRNVTVEQDGLLTASAWDGSTGGILVFRANGTVTGTGTISVNGYGFRGGAGVANTGTGFSGESLSGLGSQSTAFAGQAPTNGGGGQGGGRHQLGSNGGGGGGHGTVGNNSAHYAGDDGGGGGTPYDTTDLSTMGLGSGGGGANQWEQTFGGTGGSGGAGGGTIFIAATTLTITGAIQANGANGQTVTPATYGGGGGAGGAILLKAQTASLGTNLITASGGSGGISTGPGAYSGSPGGNGGDGRIRIEYCDTLSVSTNPLASVQKLNCNVAPVATNDSHNVNEDNTLTVPTLGVLGNDTDADGDALTAARVSGPSHGALTLNNDGSFTYTPAANYFGSDSFTYKANDGRADSNEATVDIMVDPVNDAPEAASDSANTNEDSPITVAAPGVLGNDTDVENGALTAIKVGDPSNGTLTLNSNGSFTYTPNTDFSGTDAFTYKANDGNSDSNNATVTITVKDTTPPTVTITNPVANATKVPLALTQTGITATFSEKMKAGTLNNDTVKLEQITGKGKKAKATPVTLNEVSLGGDGKTLTIKPSGSFVKQGVYRVTVTTGAKDEADNALASAKSWQFTMAKK